MISQYLDFVTGIKHNARRTKTQPPPPKNDNPLHFADRLILWYNAKANLLIRKAFTRIQFTRTLKPQKLQLLQQYILRRQETAFLSIKRYVHISNSKQKYHPNSQFHFQIAITNKVYQNAKNRCLSSAWEKLTKNKQFHQVVQRTLWKIDQTCYTYHKRAFFPQLFNIYRPTTPKDNAYIKHADHLCKVITKHQLSILFQTYSHFISKLSLKDISDLEKSKNSKRGSLHKSGQKRIEQVGELRRKIYQMKGQIDQSRIELYKKKSDGSRSYGINNIRKAEEFRNLEIATSKVTLQIEKLAEQIQHKQSSRQFRPKSQIPFQKLQQIYVGLSKIQNLKQQQKWISTTIPRKHINDFLKDRNFEVRDNLQLSQLVIIHERSQPTKKLDGYLNAQTENSSLKLLLGSLIRMKLLQVKGEEIAASASSIQLNARKLKQQTSRLRLQHRLQNKL